MNDFHPLSDLMLSKLADFFDETWLQADVDLLEDSLTVTLSSGQQYLINKHGVTQQIWVSSPFTGAHHFAYLQESWVCTRTGIGIEDLLLNEHDTYAA